MINWDHVSPSKTFEYPSVKGIAHTITTPWQEIHQLHITCCSFCFASIALRCHGCLKHEANLVNLPSIVSIIQAHHNPHALPQTKANTQKAEEANESKSQNIYGYLWCFPLVSRIFSIKPHRIFLAHLEGPEPLRSPSCEAFSPTSWAKTCQDPISHAAPKKSWEILGKYYKPLQYLITLSTERSEKHDSIDFCCLEWKKMIKTYKNNPRKDWKTLFFHLQSISRRAVR